MENLLQDQPFFPQFRSFAGTLFKQIVGQVGWDARPNEGHLDSILRTVVLGQIGSYGDTDVLTEARNRFTRFLDEPSSLHPDLRGVVYGLTAQEGDKSTYDILWQLEKKAELHEESMRLLGALTRFQQKELLQDALERSITSEVRSQDSVLVMMSVAGNKHGKEMAWEFIKANWDELDRRYGRGGFAIMRLVSMTGAFTTLEKAQEVESFFEEHPAPSAQRTIQQSLERIRLNAKWLENNRQGLTDWFANMDV
jgi:puromycin-sensitive aminopeptidase